MPRDTDRCTLHRLDLSDLPRAVADPALAALLRDGWRPLADVTLSRGEEGPALYLILSPPERVLDTHDLVVLPRWFATLCGLVVVSAAVASVVLYFGASGVVP